MLYTLGYSGWTPEAIQEEAQARHAMVCDIRYSPRSRHRSWTQGNLQRLFGACYQHVQALGNRNYKSGGPIALADYETGKQVIAETTVDPELLAGAIVEVDGRAYDGSLRTQLAKLRQQMASAS